VVVSQVTVYPWFADKFRKTPESERVDLLRPTERQRVEDQSFRDNEAHSDYSNRLLVRVSAKGRTFDNVNFSYTTFDSCYLRNCVFLSCSFIGCRFVGVNFRGSTFSKCKFEYSTFERTLVVNDILERESPRPENLKAEFARTLRLNYQQLGDAESANKAIRIELEATQAHLWNAWRSPATYYREKYRGWMRAEYFVRWLSFKALDLLWGNGESPWKLLRSVVVLFIVMAIFGGIRTDPSQIGAYRNAFSEAPTIFLGISSGSALPRWYATVIAATRLVTFGAFVSILTKRLNRR
jgi:hypothetical protein